MPLLDAEVARIRYELGYNLLTTDAAPWISMTQAFEQIIQPFLSGGASTTSATAVTAAATPTPATLTLASGDGFSSGCRVVIDVDDRQEIVTAQQVSGTSLTALLRRAHSGTYPVAIEGGESIIREILARIRNVSDKVESAATKAGLKRVEDIEWYPEADGGQVRTLVAQRMYWRDELASALGVPNNWRIKQAAGGTVAVY